MRPHTISRDPAWWGKYVSYAYASGPYQLYLQPEARKVNDLLPGKTYMRYDFSSDLVRSRQLEERPSVEDIVERGYFSPLPGVPETAIISDKKLTSWIGLDDIIHQIQDRHGIYKRNLDEIELGKCDALTAIFAMESQLGDFPAEGKEAYALNKSFQAFYQQARDERIGFWQDVSRLKQALPEAAQNYLALYRKASILDLGDETQ